MRFYQNYGLLFSVLAVFTFAARSKEKTKRQINSIVSVRPQGGSQRAECRLGSEEMDSDDGRSTKASNNTNAIVTPRTLVDGHAHVQSKISTSELSSGLVNIATP